MTSKEYQRQWRANNPDKLKAYREKHGPKSRQKYGREYFTNAVRRHRAKDPERTREVWRMQKASRRAKIAGARIEKHIRLSWLHNWESKICGICNELIEGQYHIDHIVPLSKGGAHTATNLQLAHPFCNQSKFTKLTVPPEVVNSDSKVTTVPVS